MSAADGSRLGSGRSETVASNARVVGVDEAVGIIRTTPLRDPLYLEGARFYDEIAPEVLTAVPVTECSAGGTFETGASGA
jgi:hypothetical protein